jgi:hypothetical protein
LAASIADWKSGKTGILLERFLCMEKSGFQPPEMPGALLDAVHGSAIGLYS